MVKRLNFVLVAVFAFILLVTPFATPSFSAGSMENAREGFRGVKWGDDIAQHPELVFVSNGELGPSYRNPNENLTMGGAKLEIIIYIFHKDKFMQAILGHDITRTDNVARIMKVFIERFGKPLQTYQGGDTVWRGADVTIMSEKVNDRLGRYSIMYNPILEEYQADKEKEISDGAKKDF